MSYRFGIRLVVNPHVNYQIGAADTIVRANNVCDIYATAHKGKNKELRVWDYDNKKWIWPTVTGLNPDGSIISFNSDGTPIVLFNLDGTPIVPV